MTTKQKQVVGIGALLSFAILALGYLLLVKPTKSNISTIQAQTASQVAANTQLQTQIAQLQAQQQGLLAKQVELKGIGQRIPSSSDIPGLIRDLTKVAKISGVDEATLTTGAATSASAVATTTAAAATPTTTASAAPTTTASAAPSTTTTAASAAAAAGTGATAPAAYQTIPITLAVQGNYSQLVMLMDQLENLKRLYLVKSITLSPLKEGTVSSTVTYAPDGTPQTTGDLSATVVGEVYETSADTTSIDLPALDGASGSAAVPTN